MRLALALLVAAISTRSAHAACSEPELRAKHARFAAHFNEIYQDPGRSAAAIERIKGVMQAYERGVPPAMKGSLRAVCGELDAMTAAIDR